MRLISLLPLPLLLSFSLSLTDAVLVDTMVPRRVCEPITTPLCRDVGYNNTGFPNLVESENQRDAADQLESFSHLVQIQCSAHLRFFLCSVYVPMCTDKVDISIGPCRPLCERVKSRCEPFLLKFGFSWPAKLDCDIFPEMNNPGTMCMKGPEESLEAETVPFPLDFALSQSSSVSQASLKRCDSRRPGTSVRLNNTDDSCVQLCSRDVNFTGSEKQIASIWTGCLACLTAALTTCAVITSLRLKGNLQLPERSVLFMLVCYGLSSLGYLIRSFSGYEATACVAYGDTKVLVTAGYGFHSVRCTGVFVLIFYFPLSAAVWWLSAAIVWSFSLRWTTSSMAFAERSCWLHFTAWVPPILLTVAVLIRQTAEADELLGVCNVGAQSESEMFGFLVIPNLLLTVLGALVTLWGFAVWLCQGDRGGFGRFRGATKTPTSSSLSTVASGGRRNVANGISGSPSAQLRFGGVLTAFLLPQTALLAVNLYEYNRRRQYYDGVEKPNFGTSVLKIFATFAYGIFLSLWLIFGHIRNWSNGRHVGTSKLPNCPKAYSLPPDVKAKSPEGINLCANLPPL